MAEMAEKCPKNGIFGPKSAVFGFPGRNFSKIGQKVGKMSAGGSSENRCAHVQNGSIVAGLAEAGVRFAGPNGASYNRSRSRPIKAPTAQKKGRPRGASFPGPAGLGPGVGLRVRPHPRRRVAGLQEEAFRRFHDVVGLAGCPDALATFSAAAPDLI